MFHKSIFCSQNKACSKCHTSLLKEKKKVQDVDPHLQPSQPRQTKQQKARPVEETRGTTSKAAPLLASSPANTYQTSIANFFSPPTVLGSATLQPPPGFVVAGILYYKAGRHGELSEFDFHRINDPAVNAITLPMIIAAGQKGVPFKCDPRLGAVLDAQPASRGSRWHQQSDDNQSSVEEDEQDNQPMEQDDQQMGDPVTSNSHRDQQTQGKPGSPTAATSDDIILVNQLATPPPVSPKEVDGPTEGEVDTAEDATMADEGEQQKSVEADHENNHQTKDSDLADGTKQHETVTADATNDAAMAVAGEQQEAADQQLQPKTRLM